MKKLFCFICISFMLPTLLYTQIVNIKGFVVDSLSREPLQYATLRVLNTSNAVVFTGMAYDTLASINLSNVPFDIGFKLVITHLGYQNKEIPINFKQNQKTFDCGIIALMQNVNLIKEVQVTGERKVKNLVDKIVYIVDSTTLLKALNTPDILRSFPEIMVNPITLETKIKGKENSLVLVNGINTGRSIDIRSINPKDIERVEVITSPPSSIDVDFDGVINIILKKEPIKGFSGNIDATFMANGRYVDSYSGLIFGGSKMRLSIAYSNYLRNNPWVTSEIRNNSVSDEKYSTNGFCKNPFELINNFIINLDYFASPRDFINISTTSSISGVEKTMNYSPMKIKDGTSFQLKPFSIYNNTDYFIGNYTIFYKRTLAKDGNTFSANINLHYMDGDEYSNFMYEGDLKHTNFENGKKRSSNIKFEYINHLSKAIRVTTGLQAYYQLFSGLLGGDVLENDFSNLRYNLYTDIYFGFKNFDINLGLKAENNKMEFKNSSNASNNQFAFFPSIILSRQLNNTNRVKAEYRRTSYYPSAWSFSPYRLEIDSMTAFIGNPKLNPSVRDDIEFTHSFKKRDISISNSFYYYSTNKLVTAVKSYDSNSYCNITYENTANRVRTGYKLTGSIVFFQFIQLEPNINLFYEEYHNGETTRVNTSYSTYLMLSMGLPKGFGIGGFGSCSGKVLSAQGYSEPKYSIDAIFIMKQFQKQNLSLYIALRGLSNSKEINHTIDSKVDEIRTFKQDTYGLAFRISYSFKSGKNFRMEKVNTNYESDKK